MGNGLESLIGQIWSTRMYAAVLSHWERRGNTKKNGKPLARRDGEKWKQTVRY